MKNFLVSLPLDDDGLFRRECPHCNEQFKLFVEDYQNINNKLYCPFCGLHSPIDRFYASEQLELMNDNAKNAIVDFLNESFGTIGNSFNNNKYLKVETKPMKKTEPRTIVERSDFEEVVFSCCSTSTFMFSPTTYRALYCYKCGDIAFPK